MEQCKVLPINRKKSFIKAQELGKMLDIQSAITNTAGAYVRINGLFVFAIGIKPFNGHIPVVRLGGHREGNETGWQCAVREVFEEANLQIKPFLPQATYLYDWNKLEAEPEKIHWQHESEQEPAPFLIVRYYREGKMTLSLMYLAHAEGEPTPSSEVKGLLLLKETEIHRICQAPITLQQYLDFGGNVILKENFDMSLFLEPFAQLRLLSKLLSALPETITS
jgi:8-oxo-dGTP pyrophosphatase MutT (NUDIX family)